ncbi:MAG: hypothetical protein QF844_03140 [Acidimicrobiales bacterium]|nr:hypothetical protein [Acidimicrobiales bacterium]
MVDGAAEGVAPVVVGIVVVEVAIRAGVLVVGEVLVFELAVEEAVGLVVTVGVVGVADGPPDAHEGRASTTVTARARPVDMQAERRRRRR